MESLDRLLAVDGVVAACSWAPGGALLGFRARADLAPELGEEVAEFCAAVTLLLETMARSFSRTSGMAWTPPLGWAYAGGIWTVAVAAGGRRGVFVETARADFNALFGALLG